MTSKEFVQTIRIAVEKATYRGVLSRLTKPARRQPQQRILQLAGWFHSLDTENKKMVGEVAKITSAQATYNFLLILDENSRY